MQSVSSATSTPERTPGRRGKQGETRARLVEVTIDLIRREGLESLTTTRIAREAGIAQPGFYAHFKNVDECLRTAASEVAETLRERQGEARRRAFARFRSVEDLWDLDALRATYADTLDVMLSEPTFAELFLRYRRDPSPLGQAMQSVMDRSREEITEDLWRNSRRIGYGPEHYPGVALYAEHVLALYVGAVETLLDGRFQDRDFVLDSLALNTQAMLLAHARAAGLLPAGGSKG